MVSRYLRLLLLAILLLTTAASANAQRPKEYALQDIHQCRGNDSWLFGEPSKTAVICHSPKVPSLRYVQYTQNPKTGAYRLHWTLSIIPEKTASSYHAFMLTTSDKGNAPYDVHFTKWVPGNAYLQEGAGGKPSDVYMTTQFIQDHSIQFDQFIKYYARWHDSHFTDSGTRQDCWSRSARGQANPLDCAEAEGLPIN